MILVKNIKIRAALLTALFLSISIPSSAGPMASATPLDRYLTVCQAAVSKAPSWSEAVKVLKSYEDQGLTSLSEFCSFYMRGRVDQYEIEKSWKTEINTLPSPYSQHPRLKDPSDIWRT